MIPEMDDIYIFGNNKDAQELVLKYHYSGRLAGSPVCVCTQYRRTEGFNEFGMSMITIEAVAAVFFSNPPTRWSEKVIELSRLVRREETDPKPILTKLISHGVKECRRQGHDLLVSFADTTHSHFGGIYQAASWNYHCLRPPQNDGWIVDGEFVPRRTCYAKWGTSGNKLIEILNEQGITCEKHYDSGKHLYWKALDNNGKRKAERLGLKSLPYPRTT